MQSMYGTSGNNVFVVGHCEVSGGRMYHYDGTRWQPVNLAVGRGTWHYNGIGWRRFDELGDAMGYDCFSDGKETFIVGNDNFRTCLIQGK